jgi:ribose 5-phosphate isomerase B
MKLAVGSDERTDLTKSVLSDLKHRGQELTLFGPLAGADDSWPDVARAVGEAVAQGRADEGILFCWTGTGVSMAANKVPGVRAALCGDAETARGARLWNNANVLCLSLRLTSQTVAAEIIETWFGTTYQPNPEDDACLAAMDALDRAYRGSTSPTTS